MKTNHEASKTGTEPRLTIFRASPREPQQGSQDSSCGWRAANTSLQLSLLSVSHRRHWHLTVDDPTPKTGTATEKAGVFRTQQLRGRRANGQHTLVSYESGPVFTLHTGRCQPYEAASRFHGQGKILNVISSAWTRRFEILKLLRCHGNTIYLQSRCWWHCDLCLSRKSKLDVAKEFNKRICLTESRDTTGYRQRARTQIHSRRPSGYGASSADKIKRFWPWHQCKVQSYDLENAIPGARKINC